MVMLSCTSLIIPRRNQNDRKSTNNPTKNLRIRPIGLSKVFSSFRCLQMLLFPHFRCGLTIKKFRGNFSNTEKHAGFMTNININSETRHCSNGQEATDSKCRCSRFCRRKRNTLNLLTHNCSNRLTTGFASFIRLSAICFGIIR